jgi:hypothetical protein
MGLVGAFAVVALNADPSDTTILLVAVVVTAGVARPRRSGQERPPCVEPAPAERPVVRRAMGWAAVVEGFLVVADGDLAGRSRQVITAALVTALAVRLWVVSCVEACS